MGHRFHTFDCQLGHIKRFITCLAIDAQDTFLYAGSRTGDILEVFIEGARYKRTGPVKKIFKGGVYQINTYFSKLFVSCADGTIAKIDKQSMIFEEEAQLEGGPITSITNSQEKIYALTSSGNLHYVEGEKPIIS